MTPIEITFAILFGLILVGLFEIIIKIKNLINRIEVLESEKK